MGKGKVIVYSPAYNVENTIGEFLSRMKIIKRKLKIRGINLKKLVIINDGSTDRTHKIIEQFKKKNKFVKLVEFKENKGPVDAILKGMKEANKLIDEKSKKTTIIVRIDSDMEHDPLEIPKMIKPIISKKSKVVVGIMNFEGYPFYVKWFNKIIGLSESRKFLEIGIPQFCPGFQVIRADLFQNLFPGIFKITKKYEKEKKEKFLAIDFLMLSIVSNLGEEIMVKKLKPIQKKYIRKIKLEKLMYYFDQHFKTERFLEKELSK